MKQQMMMTNDVVSHFVSFSLFSFNLPIFFSFFSIIKIHQVAPLFVFIKRKELLVAALIFSTFVVRRLYVCWHMPSIWSDLGTPSSSNSIKERFSERITISMTVPDHFLSFLKCLYSTSSPHTNGSFSFWMCPVQILKD